MPPLPPFLALGLFLLLIRGSSTSGVTCQYRQVEGRVQAVHRATTCSFSALSAIQCLQHCLCSERCLVSYNARDKLCCPASLHQLMTTWMNTSYIEATPDRLWTTYIVKKRNDAEVASVLDKPSGLWLFDNEHKCRNVGTKGPALDMRDCSSSLSWTQRGPHDSHTSLIYPKYTGTTVPKIPVIESGTVLLNMKTAFTVAFWIKTGTRVDQHPILEGYSGSAFELWLWPSKGSDQLFMSPYLGTHEYTTVVNATGKEGWRHMSVTYDGPGNVHFYLNGDDWPIAARKVSTQFMEPTYLCVWKHCDGSRIIDASLACLAIYERAISAVENRLLMRACP